MSSIGPQLPQQVSKRKRTPERDDEAPPSPAKHQRSDGPLRNANEIDLDDDDGSDDDYGPSAPPDHGQAPIGPSIGPSAPNGNQDEIDLESDSDSDTGPAPPRPSVGPAPPPAANPSARPEPADEASSSDSEDDYGPALPGASTSIKRSIGPQLPPSEPTPQRDTWMLAPPEASGYSERDPTRIRNRKFASKPSSVTPGSGISSIWTETPEEKLKRLQDSVLGREDKTQAAAGGSTRSKEEEERQRRIAANIEAQRGKSLYDEHQQRRDKSGKKMEEEDDPSKRAFDREKDMALGGKLGTAQRKELMSKSADFGGRFQKGSFL